MSSFASMDGNSAKKAPVLDHLVDTKTASAKQNKAPTASQSQSVLAPMNGAYTPNSASKPAQPSATQPTVQAPSTRVPDIHPNNRRTDKSEFEIELTNTVHKIMLRHFEDASEEIVQKVLSEVRARLPGQRKN